MTRLPLEVVDPPPAALVVAGAEGRLIPELQRAALTKDPREILIQATEAFCLGNDQLANALADLAVTGRTSYRALVGTPLSEAVLVPQALTRLSPLFMAKYGRAPTSAEVNAGATKALDRAYHVAFALRGPYPARAEARAALGWVAVSAENDPPHRPVNVVSAPFPQHEIPVIVGGVTVQARFFIASPISPVSPPSSGPRSLPGDLTPHVPDGDRVILFLHGHSSSAEEALDLIKELHPAGLAHGIRFSVISVDLPSNGYSSMHEHSDIAPSNATTWPGGIFDHGSIHTPILDFIENFIIAFVEAVDRLTPIKSRFAGVIGGSLGGNMGLRLGRRDLGVFPWLASGIVSWDSASVWSPMVQDEIKRHAPDRCREHWNAAETFSSRQDYFSEVFDKPILAVIIPVSQPQTWYRDGWEPCKSLHIYEARIARREIYNPTFRRWHWRVAGEQLIFSHIDRVEHEDPHSPFRYELNHVRQLLIAGQKDDILGSNIYSATIQLAKLMVRTQGRSLFLLDTGHSVHVERPRYLAGQIASFLVEEGPNSTDALAISTAVALASAGRASNLFVFAKTLDGRIIFNQAAPRSPFAGWQEVPGGARTDVALAAGMQAETLVVFAKRPDGRIIFNQAARGGAFVGWQEMPGGVVTDAPLASAGRESNLFVFAKTLDGRIIFNQAAPGSPFAGWQEVPGGARTDVALAAGMQAETLVVFAKRPDGRIIFNQAARGSAFVGWQEMPGGVVTDAPLASAGRESNLFVFAKTLDGRIIFNQAAPGSPFAGWQEVPGGARTDVALAAGMQAETLVVFAKRPDGRIIFNQAARGGAFVGWQEMP